MLSRIGKFVCMALVFSAVAIGVSTAQTLATVTTFNGANGINPRSALVQGPDGNFYGTTVLGGLGGGTVFKMTTAGVVSTLYQFSGSGNGGTLPYGGVVQGTDGNFYGTTNSGGTNGKGTIFQITPSGTLTTIYNFAGTDGALPWAGMVQGTDGNFYGTTYQGGANNLGTVFAVTSSGSLTTLYSFAGSDG